jgi:lipoprotein NlpI
LLQLNPRASASSAIRRAVQNYDQAARLGPEEAADMFYRRALHPDSIGLRHVSRSAHTQAATCRATLGRGAR